MAEKDFLHEKYFPGCMPQFTATDTYPTYIPIIPVCDGLEAFTSTHTFEACGGLDDFTSTTFFGKNCVKISLGGMLHPDVTF